MHTHTLHRTVSNLSCFQKISFHYYSSLTVFFVRNFRGIRMAQFKTQWKGNTSKYISLLRTSQVTYSTKL